MAKKLYFITVDTETANTSFNGKVDPSCGLVYDIGWAVHANDGAPLVTRSYVVKDVFYGMKDVMHTAYYAEKIPMYLTDIAQGKRKVATWADIYTQFRQDCKNYNISAIIAYNARFDYTVLNATTRYITKSAFRYFSPYGVEWWDSYKMAMDSISKQKKYRKFCFENGYITKHKKPRPQVKAETVYKYMTGKNDFAESHTALEDVLIEIEIYRYCRNKKVKMRRKLWND